MSHDVLARFKDDNKGMSHIVKIETATHYTLACGIRVERKRMTVAWCPRNYICEDCNKRKDSPCSTQSDS